MLPLEGIRVTDMGWVWAGNIVGQVLADFGAEVIKVESRKRLDPARQGRPIIGDTPDPEQVPGFHNVARGKYSITIDITTPAGPGLVKRLAAISDVFVENMSPHALENAGLDYAHLREVNPSIIMVSLPLASHYGPFRELRGYGNTSGALVGLDSVTGYPGERPSGFANTIADPNVALHSAMAVLAALHSRTLTGEGQYIETSMWETIATHMGFAAMDYVFNERIAQPNGSRHPVMAPNGIYPCRKDDVLDKWISIAIHDEDEWRALCRTMGDPDLASDVRFADRYRRQRNADELDDLIGEWTRQSEQYELMELLQSAGVAAIPCLDQEGRYFNPHLKEREVYVDVEHPVLGSEPLWGVPMKLSETPGRIRSTAPLLGEHTEFVLKERLGMSQAEIDELTQAQVLT